MQKTNLYEDVTYGEKGPKINVLFQSQFTKEIRILLAQGQEMKEHKTPFPIVIEVAEGEIDFGVNGKEEKLVKGAIISLEGGIPHNLIAQKNSIVRLTLSTNDAFKRVQDLAKEV